MAKRTTYRNIPLAKFEKFLTFIQAEFKDVKKSDVRDSTCYAKEGDNSYNYYELFVCHKNVGVFIHTLRILNDEVIQLKPLERFM